MEVELNGKIVHASDGESDVARCYVCEGAFLKHRLVCVGPVKGMEGVYIYRCDDCQAGSPKWIKHFMHKSSVAHLFRTAELESLSEDHKKALGKVIVEERRREIEEEIGRRLDRKSPRGSSVAAQPKKTGARSAVVVQKTRKATARSVSIKRTRIGIR